MFILAHPDDAEFLCCGTVARLTEEGCEVHYLIKTLLATCTGILTTLRLQLGDGPETDDFCQRLQQLWKTIDLLQERFGVEQAARSSSLRSASLRK